MVDEFGLRQFKSAFEIQASSRLICRLSGDLDLMDPSFAATCYGGADECFSKSSASEFFRDGNESDADVAVLLHNGGHAGDAVRLRDHEHIIRMRFIESAQDPLF
jgi:hypothetical protein